MDLLSEFHERGALLLRGSAALFDGSTGGAQSERTG